MSDTVIRDVGDTLVSLLRSQLGGLVADPQQIALVSPAEAEQHGSRLTVFLYSVTPSAELRNQRLMGPATLKQRRPPLPLDLYYLMSAFAPETIQNPTDRALEAHRLLGRAMQVFYDNGTLTGGSLRGGLPRDTMLRLSLQPITVEDLTRIWSVFPDNAYRPSVSYLVTPARIDSEVVTQSTRVVRKRTELDRAVPHYSRER